MSDIAQFFSKGFPIGATLTMTYVGDKYVAADGSEWLANTTTAPFAYTSDYAAAAGICTSPHPLMNGWTAGNLFANNSVTTCIAYDAGNTLYVTSTLNGDATNGYFYQQSSNGTSWTERAFPNTKTYTTMVFTAAKFIGVANSTTTNGVIYGTDAINWTSVTGVSLTAQDVLSDGTNQIFIVSTSTAGAYSGDAGATWASATTTAPSNYSIPGQGVGTWNAGAGLFILTANAAGVYQTSPTGQTWTLRNTQATFLKYQSFLGNGAVKFASDSTLTVAVGSGGFFCTTTDGLTWSNHGFISATFANNNLPSQVYHDGTRFVVRFSNKVFYSTNGTTWTEGALLGGGTVLVSQSSGVLFLTTFQSTALPSKLLRVADVTLTTPQTVISQQAGTVLATQSPYYRIR